MKLYGYWRSSCTYRVRIALELKGLSYEVAPVHLLQGGGEQYKDEFKAMNPMSQVPVLELDDGTRLGQSIAILEHIEEAHPEPALLPSDPALRARARQLAEIINSGIQPFQNLSVLARLKDLGVDGQAFALYHIERGLRGYEQLATQTAGEYSIGDRPTFAECALIPQLFAARRMGLDVEKMFPLLVRIDARCASQAPFAAAHPDRQPDAQQS